MKLGGKENEKGECNDSVGQRTNRRTCRKLHWPPKGSRRRGRGKTCPETRLNIH